MESNLLTLNGSVAINAYCIMATTSKTALTSKIAELRQLKLEEDTLRKLSTQMRDQMNRLKVCDLIFFILFTSFMS